MPLIGRKWLFLATLVAALVVLGATASALTSARTWAAEDVTPQQFAQMTRGTGQVFVFFSSPTCSECDLMRPLWQAVSAEYSASAKFVEVSYSFASAPIFQNYSIASTPVFVAFDGGQNVSRHDGAFASTAAMGQFVLGALSKGSPAAEESAASAGQALALNSPSIGVSALLGAGVFASPCVLPLLPGYVGYMMRKGKVSRAGSAALSLTSFTLGFVSMLAVGGAFIALGGVFWGVVVDGKILISFVLMALGVAALFNYGMWGRLPGFLHPGGRGRSLYGGVAAYSSLYGALALGCSLPLVVGAMLNIISGVDLYSMALRALAFALGFALPLAAVTLASTRSVTFSMARLGRRSAAFQKIGALGMIAASVMLVVYI